MFGVLPERATACQCDGEHIRTCTGCGPYAAAKLSKYSTNSGSLTASVEVTVPVWIGSEVTFAFDGSHACLEGDQKVRRETVTGEDLEGVDRLPEEEVEATDSREARFGCPLHQRCLDRGVDGVEEPPLVSDRGKLDGRAPVEVHADGCPVDDSVDSVHGFLGRVRDIRLDGPMRSRNVAASACDRSGRMSKMWMIVAPRSTSAVAVAVPTPPAPRIATVPGGASAKCRAYAHLKPVKSVLKAFVGPSGPSNTVLATPVVTTSSDASGAVFHPDDLNGTVMLTPW